MGVYFGITVDRGWARGAIGWIEVGEFVDFCLLFNLWTFGSLSGFWRPRPGRISKCLAFRPAI